MASVCLRLASFVNTMRTLPCKGFAKLLREALRTYTRNIRNLFCAVYRTYIIYTHHTHIHICLLILYTVTCLTKRKRQRARTHTRMHAHTCAHTHTQTHTHTHTHTHTNTHHISHSYNINLFNMCLLVSFNVDVSFQSFNCYC